LAVKTVARIGIAAWFPGPSGILIAGKYAGNLAGARYTVQNVGHRVSRRENRGSMRIAVARIAGRILCQRETKAQFHRDVSLSLSLSLSSAFFLAVSLTLSINRRASVIGDNNSARFASSRV